MATEIKKGAMQGCQGVAMSSVTTVIFVPGINSNLLFKNEPVISIQMTLNNYIAIY